FRLVDEARRAWHAGVASWKGERDINGRSIGVEIVNPGHEFGYRDFPEPQVAAVIALLTDIRNRWTIADGDIVGHSDVAPARKQDPGERFPWKQLAQAGHGLWVEPPPAPGAPLAEGGEGAAVFAFQAGLTRLGYDCAPTGVFDAATREVVSAFQRHWVQSRFDGVADGLTRARLIALLRLSGA
ncbi:MAG: N-acetylmuramoyl-L-alanine amidase, partial [Phenylobacterium sp.]|nr:N-acetylmuramoyl-L-alanine amidase [Phenylobacterium sp.]